ncbi:uncharacterized protein LOC125554523 [Triticum urartu]|uniref:uncharacterized protein LOC125554523 n=1 Tax=Triticum urartu TaxID=4572 RepID=UPI002042ED49|nr:uncharacterized protein LOC125554523 [Triticum urartu]
MLSWTPARPLDGSDLPTAGLHSLLTLPYPRLHYKKYPRPPLPRPRASPEQLYRRPKLRRSPCSPALLPPSVYLFLFSLKSQPPSVLLFARRPPWTSSSSRRRSSKSAPLETVFNLHRPLFLHAPPSAHQAVAASSSTAQVRRPAARRTSLAVFLHCIPSLLERTKSPCIKHRPRPDASSVGALLPHRVDDTQRTHARGVKGVDRAPAWEDRQRLSARSPALPLACSLSSGEVDLDGSAASPAVVTLIGHYTFQIPMLACWSFPSFHYPEPSSTRGCCLTITANTTNKLRQREASDDMLGYPHL